MSQQTAFVTDDSPSPELVNEINDAFNSNDVSAIMRTSRTTLASTPHAGPVPKGIPTKGGSNRRRLQGSVRQRRNVRWEPLDTRIAGDKVYCEYMRKRAPRTERTPNGMTIDVITFPRRPDDAKEQLHKVRAS